MRPAFTALSAAAVSRRTATCYAKVSPTTLSRTSYCTSGRQPVTSTRPYIGRGAISSHCTYTVTFSATHASLLNASLSLNWPPRFNWEGSSSSSSPHITRATARRDTLCGLLNMTRAPSRPSSRVLFFFTNAAAKRWTAFQQLLLHSHPPNAAYRDSNDRAAATAIQFRQSTPFITPSPLQTLALHHDLKVHV
jgi:hypothetical protein